MGKKGGKKKKIPKETKEKIEDLFSEASELCLLSGSQMAILATSSESSCSFNSFGHSSVDSVVSSFLSGQRPAPIPENSREMRENVDVCLARKDLGLGFWWEDEKLMKSENPEELREAVESMSKLLDSVKNLRSAKTDNHPPNEHEDDDLKKKNDDKP